MAYNGYLIKIKGQNGLSDYTFPLDKIEVESYSSKENTLYADSFTDADGYTQATPIPHKIDKVTFNTIYMTNTDFDAIMAEVSARYTEADSRTLTVNFYRNLTGQYVEASMHITDPDIKINRVDNVNNILYYFPITFTFTVW